MESYKNPCSSHHQSDQICPEASPTFNRNQCVVHMAIAMIAMACMMAMREMGLHERQAEALLEFSAVKDWPPAMNHTLPRQKPWCFYLKIYGFPVSVPLKPIQS